MTAVEWRLQVGDDGTRVVHDPSPEPLADVVFICAHGAGGRLNDRGMTETTRTLTAHGLPVVRFNFLYRERQAARPDPMPTLMRTTEAVVDLVRRELKPAQVLIGGRSMGGRAASMLAAEGVNADGLVLLAYPLHPAGQPGRLRDAHLPAIRMPVLCINGTRDALCTRALMERTLLGVSAPWRMHWIEGADHSFHMLTSSGRTDREVMEEIGAVTASWARERVS